MKVGLCFNIKKSIKDIRGKHRETGKCRRKIPPDFFAECDSIETIVAIRKALSIHNRVIPIEADENCFEKFRSISPDIVFNVAEGIYGASRESHIPSMLEFLGIPYTGSDPLTLALALDKQRVKESFFFHGVPFPMSVLAHSSEAAKKLLSGSRGVSSPVFGLLRYPLMVKPACEGSSKGIVNDSVAKDRFELMAQVERVCELYDQPAIIEEYLPGREFTVAIVGNGASARALPIVEIMFDSLPKKANKIYSFEAKWVWDTKEAPLEIFRCPAELSSSLRRRIESVSLAAFSCLNCRDWSRVDVRLDADGDPRIIEINPLPGILPDPKDNSCFPKAARAAGFGYDEMINLVLYSACKRAGIRGFRPGRRIERFAI